MNLLPQSHSLLRRVRSGALLSGADARHRLLARRALPLPLAPVHPREGFVLPLLASSFLSTCMCFRRRMYQLLMSVRVCLCDCDGGCDCDCAKVLIAAVSSLIARGKLLAATNVLETLRPVSFFEKALRFSPHTQITPLSFSHLPPSLSIWRYAVLTTAQISYHLLRAAILSTNSPLALPSALHALQLCSQSHSASQVLLHAPLLVPAHVSKPRLRVSFFPSQFILSRKWRRTTCSRTCSSSWTKQNRPKRSSRDFAWDFATHLSTSALASSTSSPKSVHSKQSRYEWRESGDIFFFHSRGRSM